MPSMKAKAIAKRCYARLTAIPRRNGQLRSIGTHQQEWTAPQRCQKHLRIGYRVSDTAYRIPRWEVKAGALGT